ncbi:MAG TPA: NrsF family protein [Reyranella sp.]|jgi:hypothetical protein|nr:NrsF family protein [Reyranella sp.]
MRTDQLIAALVADRTASAPFVRRLMLSLLAGGLVSLGLFWLTLRPRPDLEPALETWRFDFKIALMMLTVLLAFGFCRDVASPIVRPHPARRLLLSAAAIAAAIAAELILVPQASWGTRLVGSNSLICMSAIPFFSLAPLAAVLLILRSGAPASPMLAGAAAGVLAAACGATLYAFHCFDDSPLFVATWYTLAALPVVAIGAWAGHRLLRW